MVRLLNVVLGCLLKGRRREEVKDDEDEDE